MARNDAPGLPSPVDAGGWKDLTTARQAEASDPGRSAWVSANAGSGKTHVLTQRVMRLLLAGARPSAILCLTYTKAAASEMSNRVFLRLSEWATVGDDELRRRITEMEGREPDSFRLAEARRLFARALETPGGLKIQTIHAFCEALLHQFPLEANVAGHFSVLDDRAAAALLADARRSLLTATTDEDDAELAEAFAAVLTLADDTGLESLLESIVANRNTIRRFFRDADRAGGVEPALRRAIGLRDGETRADILGAAWPLPGFDASMIRAYAEEADRAAAKKAAEAARLLADAALERDPSRRFEMLTRVFLTAKGEPKAVSGLLTKKMALPPPELIAAAQARIAELQDRLRIMDMLEATLSALTLAERLDDDYEELKRRRAFLDFEDLIIRTADLLTRTDAGAWVHYKLDQGIDHILVDEAQDTSPDQWRIIRALSADFFAGKSARDIRRTLFAVGDEKQSIYSFQGARPERFSEERSDVSRRITGEGRFSSISLPLSFRSTDTVLSAVDQVFSLPDNARGLSALAEPVIHQSSRIGQPGSVEFWDMIAAEPSPPDEDWTAPFDATPESAPAAILARRIAHRIRHMIGRETIWEKGTPRTIEAGDILVLVRKRDAFVNALNRALKRNGNIPVAGADRLRLTSHIAVQDLMALGRFLVLEGDDLSLAAFLKSPLINLGEEELMDLAAYRPEGQSLWARLQDRAATRPALEGACQLLGTFRQLARELPVHDFYARVLGQHGGRRMFLARLGSEASDILDEFLSFALDHETSGLPGLSAFLSTLELESPEVKREQDKGRGEVRIMTVHASKGLEAPVVFLIDGGSKAFDTRHLPKLRLLHAGGGEVPVWIPGKAVENSLTAAETERLKTAAEEEYRRLLYVGMTRAADHLVIAGYRGSRMVADTWHSIIRAGLSAGGAVTEARFSSPEGEWEGLRWKADAASALPAATATESAGEAGKPETVPLPEALGRSLPPLPYLPRPLSPSEAGTVVDADAGEEIVRSPLFAEPTRSSRAAQRGKLTHRLLQVLPDIEPAEREAAARRYLERSARFWTAAEREHLIGRVMSILERPDLDGLFQGNGRPEVAIMGTLRLDGREFAVSGRIDRLAVSPDRVVMADFKTNRQPPATPGEAPLAHRAQLAIYREILKPLYPGRRIDCLLVYTASGAVMALEDGLLETSLAEITPK